MEYSEDRIAAQLNAIGGKYWTLWIFALILYFTHRWVDGFILALLFTFLLSVLLWKMVIPYVGLIWVLGRGVDGFSVPIRINLVLAVVNLLAVAYSFVGIWKSWPYIWAALVFSSLISLLNGQQR